jgi:hypothetical protein
MPGQIVYHTGAATTDNEQIMQDSANQPGFLFHDYETFGTTPRSTGRRSSPPSAPTPS